jgi:phosphoglycerate dehydrogenase-like enzyme
MLHELDFLVLALPLTEENVGIISKRELSLMKSSAFLVNVARGAHVVTEDLVEAIEAGGIAGAGLDVTEPEPLPPGHRLWSMPLVIISPHVASQGERVLRVSYRLLCKSVQRALVGARVTSLANPEIYEGDEQR